MSIYRKWFLTVSLLILSVGYATSVKAQVFVQAYLDSTTLFIGEQTKLRLSATINNEAEIHWPVFTDTLTKGVIVLEASVLDTLTADNNRIQIKQDLLITSFDSALYVIPPVPFVLNNDTSYTQPLVLKIITFSDIDTEQGIYDIKPIAKPEFVLSDYMVYLWTFLLSVFVFSTGMYLFLTRKKKEVSVLSLQSAKPKLPAHIQALKDLDKVKEKQIWKSGQNKEYYTQVTDILRKYIFERFEINAMEMTSEEVLSAIQRVVEYDSANSTLRKVLVLADLVKFAKLSPQVDDNELIMLNAYLFVNQTKTEPLPNKEEEQEKDTSISTQSKPSEIDTITK